MPKLMPPTDSPETPDAELARLRPENAALCATVAEQAALIAQLQQRLQELEARPAKNSRHSSIPPPTDPPFKKPSPRSQRQVSGRKPGGQKDHPGVTRELVDTPDQTVVVPLTGACSCGRALGDLEVNALPERRQVIDLVIRLQDHRDEVLRFVTDLRVPYARRAGRSQPWSLRRSAMVGAAGSTRE
ncbi:DUF6444 domain-containing protein [uncultured Lamprocystis sp.]|jgi:transposase|uniref:DUF6444 domain-containing protein n=2 Tax=uncultured Lamprocystis sp. TaxID=543132 RepID=UPI0025DCE7DA|nr:DUF6444 domain-containing protein [uncultured Lamprocystis sp.]